MSGWDQTRTGIDREYLRRCKESTPEQRMNLLFWMWEFAQMVRGKKPREAERGER